MRIDEIKLELIKKNPTLKRGSEETGYQELTGADYDEVINQWAEAAYARELEAQEAEAQAQAKAESKAALLNRLGITEAEAQLLLS